MTFPSPSDGGSAPAESLPVDWPTTRLWMGRYNVSPEQADDALVVLDVLSLIFHENYATDEFNQVCRVYKLLKSARPTR